MLQNQSGKRMLLLKVTGQFLLQRGGSAPPNQRSHPAHQTQCQLAGNASYTHQYLFSFVMH